MSKKVLLICTVLVALAVVPAVASASPVLTENGSAVEAGKKVTAMGEETAAFFTNQGTISCNDYWMTGSLHRNTGSIIEATIESARFASETEGITGPCTSAYFGSVDIAWPALTNEGGTGHWCIYANEELGDEFELKGHGCTESGPGTLTIAWEFKSAGLTCKYERSAAITGSFTTNGTVTTYKWEHEPLFSSESSNSPICPVNWKILRLSFRLYADTETEALSTSDPLTVS